MALEKKVSHMILVVMLLDNPGVLFVSSEG